MCTRSVQRPLPTLPVPISWLVAAATATRRTPQDIRPVANIITPMNFAIRGVTNVTDAFLAVHSVQRR